MNADEHRWHERFIKLAHEVAEWSKDPSTKVGCVLVKNKRVISTGYNGFPKGISDSFDRLMDREQKYEMTVHAEINAITTAALHGVSTEGSTAYITLYPCSRCASVLINAGVQQVYVDGGAEIPTRWLKNFKLSCELLSEANVFLSTLSCL
jgi:dCMP deaminase